MGYGREANFFMSGLQLLAASFPKLVKEVRGLGMMVALELHEPLAGQAQQECQEKGLLVNAIGDKVLRFLPPLIVTEAELNRALTVLEQVLAGLQAVN